MSETRSLSSPISDLNIGLRGDHIVRLFRLDAIEVTEQVAGLVISGRRWCCEGRAGDLAGGVAFELILLVYGDLIGWSGD